MTKKARLTKQNIDHFFEYGIFLPERLIYFGNDVDETTAEYIIKALHLFKAADARKQITVVVNSLGGCEYSAWAIYDTVKSLKLNVKTIAQGSCMSAATIIFLMGKSRFIGENCVWMLHDGSDYFDGERKNMERWADFGKEYRKYAYRIYYEALKQKRPRTTMKDVEEMCRLDTILTAKDVVKYGFADKII